MTGFSLKDHLFNAESLGDLAKEFRAGIPGFDADAFLARVMPGLPDRELLQRLEWITDCLEPQLSPEFPLMAEQLHAAMPHPLDPDRTDDDFGRFIHSVPGILAVRHGLEHHRDIALDLIEAATQRFSMEFYIRPFLNRWPTETLTRLETWCAHPNYHVRRLVSEGTRAKLPWAKKIDLDPLVPLAFLDKLHGDSTRYVTRSVANHLNDITKIAPDRAIARLRDWAEEGRQDPAELGWMTRHALRSLVKAGHPEALDLLGFHADADVDVTKLSLSPTAPRIGDAMELTVTLEAPGDSKGPTPILMDYIVHFLRPSGEVRPRVHKLKQAELTPGKPLTMRKSHRFKGDATTYSLCPGTHRIDIQVNGTVLAGQDFELLPS